MKVRVSHFTTKNIKVNSRTRPKPKIVSVNDKCIGRAKTLIDKLRLKNGFKVRKISSNGRKIKISVKSEEVKTLSTTIQERDFYKAESKYAYTPEIHISLKKIRFLERILNNH